MVAFIMIFGSLIGGWVGGKLAGKMKPELVEQLRQFIDNLEEEYGDIEGFEVFLDHPITDGGVKQEYADIKQFVIKTIRFTEIPI